MAEDQTRMAFMSDADEKIDPVSGNDVPPGSLPEEVRDDIDAKLSEGEYVVPADVVRYFGVKLFEDLRTEAKMGLSSMESDGRIGGEPVPEEVFNDEEVITDDDVEKLKGMLSTGMADGGLIDKFVNAAKTDPTVNKVLNDQGVTVGMAAGGVVKRYALGGYEEGKTNETIKSVLDMVKQQPELQQMLATKGLQVNTTGADKSADQLKKDNKPSETTKPIMEETKKLGITTGMAEGGMAKQDPFDFEARAEASKIEGDNVTPAQMKQAMANLDALPQYKGLYNMANQYLADEGALALTPAPTFSIKDWAILGFTPASDLWNFLASQSKELKMIKYTNADGKILELAEGVVPPEGYEVYVPPASNPSAQPNTGPEKDGNTISSTGYDPDKGKTTPAEQEDFMGMTTNELEAAMASAKKVNKIATFGSLLGPIGTIGGLMAKATMRSRGMAIGVAATELLKDASKGSAEYARLTSLVEAGKVAGAGPLGWLAGKMGQKSAENKESSTTGRISRAGTGGIYGDGKPGAGGLWELFTGKEYGAYLDSKEIDPRVGYTGTGAGGVAMGQISGSDGNMAGVVANTDSIGVKVRDIMPDITGQRSGATVFRNNDGSYFTKDFFGRKTKLDYTGPDIPGPSSGGSDDSGGSDGSGVSVATSNNNNDDGINKAEQAAAATAKQVADAKKTTAEANANVDYTPSAGGFGKGKDRFVNKVEYDSDFYNKGGLLKKKKTKSYANGGYVTANEPAKTKKKKSKGLGTRP